MRRPVNISPRIYAELEAAFTSTAPRQLVGALARAGYDLHGIDNDKLKMCGLVLRSPSRFLASELHILEKPELLAGLFIEFDDGELDAGHTYLIDREAAEEIAAGDTSILLRSGGEGFLVPRERIARAFSHGCALDYQEPS